MITISKRKCRGKKRNKKSNSIKWEHDDMITMVYCGDDMMPAWCHQHGWRSHAVYKTHKKAVSLLFTKESDCFLAVEQKMILLLFFAYCHSLFLSFYYFVRIKQKCSCSCVTRFCFGVSGVYVENSVHRQ